MLVSKESTSKDAINKPASCSQIILANSKESFKVTSLEVRFRNKGTKNFAHLSVPVLREDKLGLNLVLTSSLTSSLCILDDPYLIPGYEPCG